MAKTHCKRCSKKINHEFYAVMYPHVSLINYCCSQECYDIVNNEILDQICIECDRGTTTYLCTKCKRHKDNEINNVICALCDCHYNVYFKMDKNINKYICDYCKNTLEDYFANKDIILKYINLSSIK